MNRRSAIFFGVLLLFSVQGFSQYLLSDLTVLRTPEAVYTMVYLAPNQYLTYPDYLPSPVGTVLERTAFFLGKEAGDFAAEQLRNFYGDRPEVMDYLAAKVFPRLENGRILDGHSNVLVILKSNGEGSASTVGVIKGSWLTEADSTLGSIFAELATIESAAPNLLICKEARLLEHLTIDTKAMEDIVAFLAHFGSDYGIFGKRREYFWEGRFRERVFFPSRFYLICNERIKNYYIRRGKFREEVELSRPPARVVLSLEFARWEAPTVADRTLPGKTGVRTLFQRGTLERIQATDLVKALDFLVQWKKLPTAEEFLTQIRRGEFQAVTEQARCEHFLKSRGRETENRKLILGNRGIVSP